MTDDQNDSEIDEVDRRRGNGAKWNELNVWAVSPTSFPSLIQLHHRLCFGKQLSLPRTTVTRAQKARPGAPPVWWALRTVILTRKWRRLTQKITLK